MTMVQRVAFIGLGNMGWPMAARLVGGGCEVTGCDAVEGRAEALPARSAAPRRRMPTRLRAEPHSS